MTEDRRAVPRVHEPHAFNLAWLRATPGEGVLRHRHDETQVLIVKSGRWQVTLNDGDATQTTELGPQDTLSVPAGSWRQIQLVEAGDDAATAGHRRAAGGQQRRRTGPAGVGARGRRGAPSTPAGCSTRTATWPRWPS